MRKKDCPNSEPYSIHYSDLFSVPNTVYDDDDAFGCLENYPNFMKHEHGDNLWSSTVMICTEFPAMKPISDWQTKRDDNIKKFKPGHFSFHLTYVP